MHTWHDILKHLDPADFSGTTDRHLAQVLLVVEARDWFMASGMANLGYDLACGIGDSRSKAVFLIVRGVAQFQQCKQLAAMSSLETAITMLSRFPEHSAQMNEAIASIAWSIVLAKDHTPYRRLAVVNLAHNALVLLTTAMNHYASAGNYERWWDAKDLHEWVGERLDGAVPVKYIVQA